VSLRVSSPDGEPYVLYGDLEDRRTVMLAGVIAAKRLPVRLVETTPSLTLALASRAGREEGPFLRTPEGFVLADSRAMLDWLERTHPEPALLPPTPIRRLAARWLEEGLEYGIARATRPAWETLERLAAHLDVTDFLLGARAYRPDWALAAWLETGVLAEEGMRAAVEHSLPSLCALGERLLDPAARGREAADDALPVTLLDVLEALGHDYGAWLEWNHATLTASDDDVASGFGGEASAASVQPDAERGRLVIAREVRSLDRNTRRRVAGVFEPLHLWQMLRLPPAIVEVDPGDPRSL
jgi:glutathione S-transferase